jgi:hypothetical protein
MMTKVSVLEGDVVRSRAIEGHGTVSTRKLMHCDFTVRLIARHCSWEAFHSGSIGDF